MKSLHCLSWQAESLALTQQSCCWKHRLNRHRCCRKDRERCASWQRCGSRPNSLCCLQKSKTFSH